MVVHFDTKEAAIIDLIAHGFSAVKPLLFAKKGFKAEIATISQSYKVAVFINRSGIDIHLGRLMRAARKSAAN